MAFQHKLHFLKDLLVFPRVPLLNGRRYSKTASQRSQPESRRREVAPVNARQLVNPAARLRPSPDISCGGVRYLFNL
jgi:hypothetical protein